MSNRIQINHALGKTLTTCIVVLASKEYEPWIEVQRESLERWGNGIDYIVVPAAEITKENGYLEYEQMVHRLNAARPKVILKYLEKYDQVIFVGADCYFTGPFREVLKKYPSADALAAVHTTSPLPDDGASPTNWGNHIMGHLNADFHVWRRTASSREFLEWWSKQTELHRLDADYLTQPWDQVWLNYAPNFVNNFVALKEPGINVAYYNLHERKITKDAAGRWRVNEQLMYFFQFSGFEPSRPGTLSKYNTRKQVQSKEVFELMQEFTSKFKVE